MTRESAIEKFFCREAKKLGTRCYKLDTRSARNAPDRIAIHPLLKWPILIEFKAPGEKPRPSQKAEIEALLDDGFDVRVIDSKEAASDLIDEMSLHIYCPMF
jgi:hypothetical protein